jgi:hypothetical protein
VVSLRIRIGQLIRLDSHQLDYSLVGCSNAPVFMCCNRKQIGSGVASRFSINALFFIQPSPETKLLQSGNFEQNFLPEEIAFADVDEGSRTL